jgi:hypothetical protein
MAASRFVEVTHKEISEIKINSVPKITKDLCKNTKTIIRLMLGDYRGIFISANIPRLLRSFQKLWSSICYTWLGEKLDIDCVCVCVFQIRIREIKRMPKE